MTHFPIKLLVKAESKKQAIEKARSFLEPYEGHEWDSYLFGGRFAWSNLLKKYRDCISRPEKLPDGREGRIYWNPYHDEEVKGKTALIVFPDNSAKQVEYGYEVEYAIKKWIDDHPEESEVIDATHPNFWKEIEASIEGTKESLRWYRYILREFLEQEKLSLEDLVYGRREAEFFRIPLWLRRIAELMDSYVWVNDKRCFNVERGRDYLTPEAREEIKRDPRKWFLVNIDLHH